LKKAAGKCGGAGNNAGEHLLYGFGPQSLGVSTSVPSIARCGTGQEELIIKRKSTGLLLKPADFWYVLRDLLPGFRVRSLSEGLRQMLSGPFGAVPSGVGPPFMLSAPLTPQGDFLFWVRLWVKPYDNSKTIPQQPKKNRQRQKLIQKPISEHKTSKC